MANHTKPAVAKPARPINALLGQLPSPVGGVVVKNPSPSEKQQLKRLGVEDEKKLPANFAEISRAAIDLVTAESRSDDDIPLPVPEDTKPLEINSVDIASLPKEQQARYQELIQSSLRQMHEMFEQDVPGSMEKSVAAAVAAGNAPQSSSVPSRPVIDDTQQDTYSTGVTKELPESPTPGNSDDVKKAVSGNCSRCGFPKDQVDDVKPDDFDTEAYFDALMAGTPFQKTFDRYNGRMTVVVRGLRMEELDAIRKQLREDERSGLCKTELDFRIRADQLQNCLQLVSLSLRGKSVIVCPTSLAEWGKSPGEVCTALCVDDVLRTMTLYRTVAAAITEFNSLEHKLEQLSRDPSFCGAGN